MIISPPRGRATMHPERASGIWKTASGARTFIEDASMPPRLKISRDADDDGWLVDGLPNRPCRRFQELQEGLDWAQHTCSTPVDIEIWIDNFYLFVPQGRGWPRTVSSSGTPWSVPPAAATTDKKQPWLRALAILFTGIVPSRSKSQRSRG